MEYKDTIFLRVFLEDILTSLIFSFRMKILCLVAWAFTMLAASVSASFSRDENSGVSDLMSELQQILEDNDVEVDLFDGISSLNTRDDSTIENIVVMINNTGLLWDLLDAVADNPHRIQNLANVTAGLIKTVESKYSVQELLLYLTSSNVTRIIEMVQESGLVTSTLDGILLDEDFRPTLVHLIERVINANMDTIQNLIHRLQSNSLKKRADSDTDGTFQDFITQILSSTLSSGLLSGILQDTLDALNDTGVAVYTIKRFLSDDSYVNMTIELTRDIMATGALNFTGSINITSLTGLLLDNLPTLTGILSSLLNGGNLNKYQSLFGKYLNAFKAIIKDLENDGVFVKLNSLFSSTSTRRSLATRMAESPHSLSVSLTKEQKNAQVTTSESGAAAISNGRPDLSRFLLYLQTSILGFTFLI